MSRYIDAELLKREIRKAFPSLYMQTEINTLVNLAPSIDIVPRKAVKGYEGYYEVDMYGRVYSVERTVQVNDNGRIYDKPVKGRAFPWCQKFRDELGGKGFCSYGKEYE